MSATATPLLDSLIDEGAAWTIDGEVIGLASDGVEVNLGSAHKLAAVELYLADYPTRADW